MPELVRPSDGRISLRGYSVQLLALLQAGEIDYSFEYESVARQFGLRFAAVENKKSHKGCIARDRLTCSSSTNRPRTWMPEALLETFGIAVAGDKGVQVYGCQRRDDTQGLGPNIPRR